MIIALLTYAIKMAAAGLFAHVGTPDYLRVYVLTFLKIKIRKFIAEEIFNSTTQNHCETKINVNYI
jgi:hypothetical protein